MNVYFQLLACSIPEVNVFKDLIKVFTVLQMAYSCEPPVRVQLVNVIILQTNNVVFFRSHCTHSLGLYILLAKEVKPFTVHKLLLQDRIIAHSPRKLTWLKEASKNQIFFCVNVLYLAINHARKALCHLGSSFLRIWKLDRSSKESHVLDYVYGLEFH